MFTEGPADVERVQGDPGQDLSSHNAGRHAQTSGVVQAGTASHEVIVYPERPELKTIFRELSCLDGENPNVYFA